MRLVEGHIGQGKGFTLVVQASSNGGRLVVTADGRGLEGRAGAGLLRQEADRFGLTAGLRDAVDRVRSWETHAPGAVVRDLAVMLADGGTCVSDIAALRRGHDALFATVASQPTAWRTLEAIADDDVAMHRIFDAVAAVRGRVWRLGATPDGWDDVSRPVYVDIDATLGTAQSEKDGAAGTYKGGFGFAPIVAFVDRGDGRGEPLGCCCGRATPPRTPSPTTPTSSNKRCSGCPTRLTASRWWRAGTRRWPPAGS
jgi:hypothetical protein